MDMSSSGNLDRMVPQLIYSHSVELFDSANGIGKTLFYSLRRKKEYWLPNIGIDSQLIESKGRIILLILILPQPFRLQMVGYLHLINAINIRLHHHPVSDSRRYLDDPIH